MDFNNLLERILPPLPPAPDFKEESRKNYAYPSFAGYLRNNGMQDLAAIECIRLYRQCMPFYDSVSRRAEAFSSLPIRAYDNVKMEYVPSKTLALLNRPNIVQSQTSFKKSISSYYDICGEAFIIATLSTRGEPLEIYSIRPQDVSATSVKTGSIVAIARSYLVSNSIMTETFNLDEGTYRYRNRTNTMELWHLKEFNPTFNTDNLRGMPKASPLWLQIQQFIEADTNNYSILKRGGRPSLAWVWQHDEPMTDEQYQRWKDEVQAYEGSVNAGRQVLLDNMELKDIGINNKDMEFAVNRKTVKEDIYSAFSIPLALVSSSSMTMDNLKVSALLFFEQSVLPQGDNLLDELSRFLMPLFKESTDVKLTYNPIEIQALKERMIEEAIKVGDMGIAMDNELRSKVGLKEVTGANVIYKSSMLVPVAGELPTLIDDDDDSNHVSADPADVGTQVSGDDAGEKMRRYTRYMKTIKNSDGKRQFTDSYITQSAQRLYGQA